MMTNQLMLLAYFWAFTITAIIPKKVLICGVCKDVADRVPYSIKIMEKIGNLFEDYRIIVYENNSLDNTPTMLKEWAQRNNKVLALTEFLSQDDQRKIFVNRLENGEIFRPESIARARNIVLDNALSARYQDFEYLIMMDMDFKLEPDYQGIQEVFTTSRQWDAVFAYGVDPSNIYWDWYALRDIACPLGSELLGQQWWHLPHKLVLNPASDWYPVYSAFGGCGIYKKKSIQECHYSAWVTQDLAQVAHYIIQDFPHHKIIKKYLKGLKKVSRIMRLNQPEPTLSKIQDPTVGFLTNNISEDIVWRMSSFVYHYPSVCEHVTFHASMIAKGHDKLFINPRLIFRYGG